MREEKAMSFEQKINYQLNKFPSVKRAIKRMYQLAMYTFSSKIKLEGDIVRVSPDDGAEYFFGYYDKSPWDATGRYMLCMKAKDTWSDVSPKEPSEIILIDTQNGNKTEVLAKTHAWNVQQSCMLQWLGPDYESRILYNDFRDDKYCSVILTLADKSERVIPFPVYSVAADGTFALSLDFSRLYRLRPGYGYFNALEATANEKLPDKPCIWHIDLMTGAVSPILKYNDFATFRPRPEMQEKDAEHKVNHIMISPNGKRFMVLYRWFNGSRKYTRLVTCNVDGTDMYVLSDDDMVSHCYWKNDAEILAFENKHDGGPGYYLMKDKTQEYKHLWSKYSNDGHPSYSPDGSLIVTDSYPNRARIADIKLLKESEEDGTVIAKVFAPFKYDNDTRCDLHPRWSRDGKKICFDSVLEGHRGLYMVPLDSAYSDTTGSKLVAPKDKSKKRIRIVYLMTSCRRSGPTQVVINIIKNLDSDIFEPILVTLYDEQEDSDMAEFLPYVSEHYLVKTGKKAIMLGQDGALRKKLKMINPDIIHSTGVFPDYAVSQMGEFKQMITLHNYVYEDYLAKFGKIKGTILAKMQLSAMKKTSKTVACSDSLRKIYHEKLKLDLDYIRNGVDVNRYTLPVEGEKKLIRQELALPQEAFIFVYTGQFIERKNVPFLLENYLKQFGNNPNTCLLMLGAGPELDKLRMKYKEYKKITFLGHVSNVNHYLKACDVYVSTSKSEGLPNGVLEAMATGLPVILSDIMQHKEILEVNEESGSLYRQGNGTDFMKKLQNAYANDAKKMGNMAYIVAHEAFSASKMSKHYQDYYIRIVNG
ncbi:glycosyltransferase [Desulfosporosinus sp. FKA]|uniref:glycosyltransferase n=1 Tax=Desulfosporosinus sp. FKA TaxID=1969834 RepID=UPI000B4993C7|nr:glycosyltransferase [Desulfosporosinus sp. FKA]